MSYLCSVYPCGASDHSWVFCLFAGKIPKLYTEVEVSSQRDPHPGENPGAVPEAPGRSSLQVAARNPTTMKPPKNARAGEWSQQSDEEYLDSGLFIPLDKCCD